MAPETVEIRQAEEADRRPWNRNGLVAAAIDWARARGLHKLALSVFPDNEAAIALYRKFGFVEGLLL